MRNDGIHMPELSEPTLDELERLAEAAMPVMESARTEPIR